MFNLEIDIATCVLLFLNTDMDKDGSCSSKKQNNSHGLDLSNIGAECSPHPGIKAVGIAETGTGTMGTGTMDMGMMGTGMMGMIGVDMVGMAVISDAIICAAVGVLLQGLANIAG